MQQLGIPSKLAPVLFSQALSRLFLVYSAYAVIFAELLFLVIAAHEGNWIYVGAGVAIGMPGFILWRVMFTPLSPWTVGLYILTLGTSLGFATWVSFTYTTDVSTTVFLPLTLVGFALVTACGAATKTSDRLLWATIGYVVATAATIIGALVARAHYEFDIRLLVGYVIVCIAVVATPRLIEADTKFQSTFDRSAEEVSSQIERSGHVKAVAAQLHDTVLANLALISVTKPGLLSDQVRDALQAQIAVLETSGVTARASHAAAVLPSSLDTDVVENLISQAESMGLKVTFSGDADAVSVLSPDRVEALVGAVTQCITNVSVHSGQDAVEIVLLNAGEYVSVTILDGGCGFNPDGVPEDRMGLKLSVRSRIESCGGRVRVWSQEGHGTAVLLQIPVHLGGENA